MSRINLLDTPAEITKKIKRCKTDPVRGLEFDNPDRPECHNLLGLYGLLTNKTKAETAAECTTMGWGQFKPLLTEATIAALEPIQTRYHEVMDDQGTLEQILQAGKEKAEAVANQTLGRVKKAMGFVV
jgi:tryptophanyl-tRNA synthetase